ncbi:hypothetical protein [Aquabacterium sp. OR-4]|uniref:hypothetical protein n=1 Tax=Aquabacterium sp. OR-4 TaxID=2978127 RepID=UPI0021B34230|nr:hypothetical protein [Aquabacterium sp. OR-4]MDT7834992.1 hypothetical protein [Aquabacterium sp. OR-4]
MKILAAALALVLTGCATTDGLAPTVSRAGFDGARVVDIAPHGAACPGLPCEMLGAQWTSARPGAAVLVLRITGPKFVGVRGLRVSVDGAVRALLPAGLTRFDPGLGPLSRESTQPFGVDLALIRQITAAQRVWLRVETLDGVSDVAVIDGATDSKALHALRRFLAQVDAQQ